MVGITQVLRGNKPVRKAIADLRKLVEGETDVVNRIIGTEAVKGVRQNIRNQRGPGGETWPPLKMRAGARLRDTGRLYNSITWDAPLGSKTVRIGTNVIYAALQHFGGRIVPRRAKMLAIPISTRIRRQYSGNFRTDFPDAFVYTSRRGNTLLARRSGTKGRLENLAILRRSVTVPASPFMGLSSETWAIIRKRLEGKVAEITRDAKP